MKKVNNSPPEILSSLPFRKFSSRLNPLRASYPPPALPRKKKNCSLREFGKEAFSMLCSPYENCFFSLEMLKNILSVMGLYAHILAVRNFLLNN